MTGNMGQTNNLFNALNPWQKIPKTTSFKFLVLTEYVHLNLKLIKYNKFFFYVFTLCIFLCWKTFLWKYLFFRLFYFIFPITSSEHFYFP